MLIPWNYTPVKYIHTHTHTHIYIYMRPQTFTQFKSDIAQQSSPTLSEKLDIMQVVSTYE